VLVLLLLISCYFQSLLPCLYAIFPTTSIIIFEIGISVTRPQVITQPDARSITSCPELDEDILHLEFAGHCCSSALDWFEHGHMSQMVKRTLFSSLMPAVQV